MSFSYVYTEIFSCGSTLWPWVAGLLINSTLLLSAIALFGPLAGRRNPALRHATSMLGLAGLALLPAISLTLGGASGIPDAILNTIRMPASTGLLPGAMLGGTIDPGQAIAAIWVACAALLLVRLIIDLAILEWQARNSLLAPDSWNRMARRLAWRHDLRRPVRVLRTGAVDIPCTWGSLRPVILLPEHAFGWSRERLETVLLHELGHIRRKDGLSRFLARVACALFWFHPLAWWIERTARGDAERSCDRMVIEAGVPAGRYARHMLQIVRDAQRPARAIAPPMAAGSHLGRRIAALLDPRPVHARAGRLPIAAVAAAVIAVTMLLGVVSAPAVSARTLPYGELGCPGRTDVPEPTVEQFLNDLAVSDRKLITSANER